MSDKPKGDPVEYAQTLRNMALLPILYLRAQHKATGEFLASIEPVMKAMGIEDELKVGGSAVLDAIRATYPEYASATDREIREAFNLPEVVS